MRIFSGLFLLACVAGGGLQGQEVPPAFERGSGANTEEAGEMIDPFDPATDAPRLIRVQVEYIELAQKVLTRTLMEGKPETADATELRMKVQGIVDGEDAIVLDTQMAIGRSGQKATSGSGAEFIFPTEYIPTTLPGTEETETNGKQPQQVHPVLPTAFETRNLGGNLEIEPTLGEDGHIVDLRVLTSMTWLTGNTVWSDFKDALGNNHKVLMPDLYAMEINTSLSCIPGQYCLLGVVTPKDAKGRMDPERKVMVFVKCEVLPVIR